MLFKNVAIAGLAHVDAPHRVTSDEINARLKPTIDRLGIKTDVLKDIAGIHARRLWDDEVQASDAATMAGHKALDDAGIDVGKLGLLVNTSVSRDYLEPSTASIVGGNLGIPDTCQNYDLANACLAFVNGMDVASRMIELGEIDYAAAYIEFYAEEAKRIAGETLPSHRADARMLVDGREIYSAKDLRVGLFTSTESF